MKLNKLTLVVAAIVGTVTAAHAQKWSTGQVWTTKEPSGVESTPAVQSSTTTQVWTKETTVAPPTTTQEPAGAATMETTETHWYSVRSGDLYHANEFSFDAFATYASPPRFGFSDVFNNNIRDGDWGGGAGVNYFFLSWLGVGADVVMGANGHQFVDSASGNLILRLPLNAIHVAPYVFGGGGGQFDPKTGWMADFGTGLDVRFTHMVGLFADVRFVWTDKTGDYGLFRTGLRFAF